MIFTNPCSAVQNIQRQIESISPHISIEDIKKRLFCFLIEVKCFNKTGEWKKPCAILVKINIERMEITFFTSFYEFKDVLEIKEHNLFDILDGTYIDLVPFIEQVIAGTNMQQPFSTEIFVSVIRTFAVEKIVEGETSAIISWADEYKHLIQHPHDEKTDTLSFVSVDDAVKVICEKLGKLHTFSSGIVLYVSVRVCLTSDEEDEESGDILLLFHRPYKFTRAFEGMGSLLDVDHPERLLIWKVLTKEHNGSMIDILSKRIQKCIGELKNILVGNHICTDIELSSRTISVDNVVNSYGMGGTEDLMPDISSAKTEDELYKMLLETCNIPEDYTKPPSGVLIFWKPLRVKAG